MRFDADAIAQLVRDELARVQARPATTPRSTVPGPWGQPASTLNACKPPDRPPHAVDDPALDAMLARLVAQTSSQIAVGRAGCRMKTDLALRLREGHADAKDAVNSSVPEGWPEAHGLLPLRTTCKEHHEYLLYPNHGRRLDDASLAKLQPHAGTAPDVALISGDGLSATALLQNGPESLQALTGALTAAGLTQSPPLFVRHARIGVQDQIGVTLKARATVILVGERPGLGTGDSLSFYIAVNPKLDQDNAEKNCVSNVRPIGIRPAEAAKLTVEIVQRAFERGGGVAIGFGYSRQ